MIRCDVALQKLIKKPDLELEDLHEDDADIDANMMVEDNYINAEDV
jgi:hypothetical protein